MGYIREINSHGRSGVEDGAVAEDEVRIRIANIDPMHP